MNIHKEIHFEGEICEHLSANGWLYAGKDAADYDHELALFPADVLAWALETQTDAWGDLSENDKLVYLNNVIIGKLLESETLVKQAVNNTKEQFANSPDLTTEITNAIIDALDAHNEMSSQALGSEEILLGLKEILLGPASLYEKLRAST